MIAEFVTLVCAGLFTGASVYISLVQQPAAMKLDTAEAVRFFAPMYDRAAPIQASLALLGAWSALCCWWTGGGSLWLFGGIILALMLPFTVVIIKPTNDRLKDPALDASSDEADHLLARWSRLHAVRSMASALSFFVFLIALLSSY